MSEQLRGKSGIVNRSWTLWLFKPRVWRSRVDDETEWMAALPPLHLTVYTSRRGLRHTSGHFWFGPFGVHAFIDKGHLPHRVSFERTRVA